jgi:2-dehydro-3-deoxygluconokinase
MKVACIGECMIEMRPASSPAQSGGALLSRGFGGDTLNTAVYLARLSAEVDYITALGDDPLSDEMIAAWQAEGVGTGAVARLAGKLPGLYLIETNEAGERRFYHWRENSAARSLMSLPQTPVLLDALANYDVVYLSAITLSLFNDAGRQRLFVALTRVRDKGVKVAFDTNYRARGWPDSDLARRVYNDAFAVADIVLASVEDLAALYPGESHDAIMARIGSPEVVLKLPEPQSLVRFEGHTQRVKAEPVNKTVVDTTAAGDSFAAAYIAARLDNRDPVAAAQAGHHLAGTVVCYPGAIIPRDAMPARMAHADGAAL